jgi:hypothetical protein
METGGIGTYDGNEDTTELTIGRCKAGLPSSRMHYGGVEPGTHE